MKNVSLKSSLALMFSSVSAAAFAAPPSLRIPSQIIGSRPAGLGGAFTAVADDQNALFYNPAGLAHLDSTFAAILDMRVAASAGSGGVGSLIQDIENVGAEAKKLTQNQGTQETIKTAMKVGELVSSKTVAFGTQSQSYFATKNLGFALTTSMNLGFGVHAQILPEVADFGLVTDGDFRAAYSHQFLDGKASLGVAPYYRMRAQGGLANFSVTELKEFDRVVKSTISVGHGFGTDFGLMIRPVEAMSPTFGLSILNVGDTKFYKASYLESVQAFKDSEIAGTPDSVKQVVNVGFSVSPIDGPGFVRLSGELREINRPSPAELKPAFGVETGFRSRFIRALIDAGWGNNNWTAGIEHRSFVKLRFATYVEPELFFDRKENQRVWVVSLGL